MRRLVAATQNKGKIREITALLAGLGLEVLPIAQIVPDFDVEETGATFLDNARLKAVAAFEATGLPSLADDSGLCVVGLGLEPGVRSSRYAGEGCCDEERVAYLLSRMGGITGSGRTAWFECTLYGVVPADWAGPDTVVKGPDAPMPRADAWITREDGPDGYVGIVARGRLPGRIGYVPRGENGFGYDPVFHPDADPSRTLAEYGLAEKNRISHRGIAFFTFAEWLRCRLAAGY